MPKKNEPFFKKEVIPKSKDFSKSWSKKPYWRQDLQTE